MADRDCSNDCGRVCESVFARIRVRPTIRFGTWVEWQLHPDFTDDGPLVYQLQVGHTGLNQADDWQNVGPAVENVSYVIDPEQRIYGQTQWTHYRVELTAPSGVYYSPPQHTWGDLPPRLLRLVLNRERLWRLQLEKTHRGQKGYLLKRRLVGAQPALGEGILDYQTREIVNPQAAETVGTEFIGGYYAPIPCVYAGLSNIPRREHLDSGQMRGTVNDGLRVVAEMLATPQIDSRDVWVDADTDFRWQIHEIRHAEEISGVPIVVQAEFRLLPFTHPVYGVEITGQLPLP